MPRHRLGPKGPFPNENPKVSKAFPGSLRAGGPALPVYRGGTRTGSYTSHPFFGGRTLPPRGFALSDFDRRGLRRVAR